MADGEAYLQRLIEIHQGSVADQRSLLLGLQEVRSAADALVAVEALTRERAHALVDAFTHELGGRRGPPREVDRITGHGLGIVSSLTDARVRVTRARAHPSDSAPA